MDFYRDAAWRAAHPQIAALWDRVQESPREIIRCQYEDTCYLIIHGIWGNPDGFMLAWGKPGRDLLDLLAPRNDHEWIVQSDLSRLFEEAKQEHDVDVLSIPVEAWKPQREPER